MGDLDAAFQQASRWIGETEKNLVTDPGNDAKLRLYALYKQGTSGDVSGKRPGRLDTVGRTRYDTWSKLKGLSQDSAKQQYVELVRRLGV